MRGNVHLQDHDLDSRLAGLRSAKSTNHIALIARAILLPSVELGMSPNVKRGPQFSCGFSLPTPDLVGHPQGLAEPSATRAWKCSRAAKPVKPIA